MDILTTDLEATIAFHPDAVVGSASGKNHSGCQSPERDTEANDELGSGLIDHSQNMTAAAMQIAEK